MSSPWCWLNVIPVFYPSLPEETQITKKETKEKYILGWARPTLLVLAPTTRPLLILGPQHNLLQIRLLLLYSK